MKGIERCFSAEGGGSRRQGLVEGPFGTASKDIYIYIQYTYIHADRVPVFCVFAV